MVGSEQEKPVHIREFTKPPRKLVRNRAQSLYENSACTSPIALPQLRLVGSIVDAEEQDSVYIRQVARVRPLLAGNNVLDENCSRGGPIAFPQLRSIFLCATAKVDNVVYIDEQV